MTDKIKFYLEDRLKRLEDIKNKREWTTAELGDATCCKQTLAFINSLQEEPDPYIQYASREAGIKAHAEDYSFNIESELFQQLTTDQQNLWRREIEQAVISGGYCGLNLSRDKRYDKEEPVSEELGEYINELSKQFPEVSFAKLSRIAVRVAKWQKENLWKPADGDDLPENKFGLTKMDRK